MYIQLQTIHVYGVYVCSFEISLENNIFSEINNNRYSFDFDIRFKCEVAKFKDIKRNANTNQF